MARNIYEIFDEFEKAKNKQEKIDTLRKHSSWALKNVLKGTFDPNINFTIKSVKYKASDAPVGLGYSNMHKELDRAYLFEENNPRVDKNLSQSRKEQILTQILEALEAREADVFINMLNKKQKVKGLDYKVVKEAFPDLLP